MMATDYKFYGIGFLLLLVAGHAVATDAASPRQMKLTANIQEIPIECSVGFEGGIDTVSFGTILPSQISGTPGAGDVGVDSVFNYSNFNQVYSTSQPLATLKISCATISPPSPLAFQVQYGTASQIVVPTPGNIRSFKLDSGPNQNYLTFAMFARDRYSTTAGRVNQYVTPGQNISLQNDSFRVDGSRYSAFIQMFPALYWVNSSTKTFTPGVVTTSVGLVVSVL